ncbi:Peptidoglycan-binding domain 1 protein [Shewanella halifaxensis HAW-EB4]|uniref:Peptidoglycan-binding domain 1 protein n=1 Tax=Shewanella halifaxensis (strain HAW-EB4) TaxID=458817 RepID=B0TVG1_SHEHH|nr:L,D-transpeptidase family protein [Shewanella halifaxensis]ABZ76846.1 Peptidoglycan-binding domain 1 protein [Shewanella halifaxensis HAW-EB4]
MLSRLKLVVYHLLISLLIILFPAQVRAEPSFNEITRNSEASRQLRALAFDLNAGESVNELMNMVNLARLLDRQVFWGSSEHQSLSVEQYLNLVERKDIQSLRKLIKHYRSLERYQWPTVAPMELRLGLRTKEVAKLRWILTQVGDITPYSIPAYRESIFDPSVEAGLKLFQRRHGHAVDGKLGSQTLLSLNTEPSIRVAQLQNALKQRLKRFDEAKDYVLVNLMDHTLRITKNGVEQLVMPVIVGKPTSKTPELNTTISVITVNPSWTPPASIIYQDILQSVDKQPNYLRNNDFAFKSNETKHIDHNVAGMDPKSLKNKLKKSVLVQLPGTKNALGKYRFTIPNSDAIFLHDTPSKHLFKRQNRALSHGCIRLSQPALFAQYLINKEPAETRLKFKNAVKSKQTRHFRLTSQLSIDVIYQTVWIDKDGSLQVRGTILDKGAKNG